MINLKANGAEDQHIPYRNSPLTKILKASLGGNSRTAIVLCMTPCMRQFDQTQSTLRFGQNAKMIRNRVTKNLDKLEKREQLLESVLSSYENKI